MAATSSFDQPGDLAGVVTNRMNDLAGYSLSVRKWAARRAWDSIDA
jgi:hypothetical protein